MALDVKQYIEQLAQTAGLSDEEKAGILKVAANDKFAKSLSDDLLRQQDYSRNMDALKANEKRNLDEYNRLLTWQAAEQKKLDDFYAQYGTETQRTLQPMNGEYLTKKDLEALDKKYQEELSRREQVQISLLKDVGRIASSHVHEFHEPLDTDALEKLAVERKLTLRQAYEEMVSPRRAEAQSKAFADKLAQAREEGAKEFASKHKIQVDTAPREYHVMLDRDPQKQVGATDYVPNSGMKTPAMDRQLRSNFVEAWDSASSGTSSST